MSEQRRVYGVDRTDDFETLAEGTLNDDGTITMDVVVLDLAAPSKGDTEVEG